LGPSPPFTLIIIATDHTADGKGQSADCNLENVGWKEFEGEAAPHDLDPQRFINWRFFWDYSGGNVFENMVHQLAFWYKVLGLKIPRRVTMSG